MMSETNGVVSPVTTPDNWGVVMSERTGTDVTVEALVRAMRDQWSGLTPITLAGHVYDIAEAAQVPYTERSVTAHLSGDWKMQIAKADASGGQNAFGRDASGKSRKNFWLPPMSFDPKRGIVVTGVTDEPLYFDPTYGGSLGFFRWCWQLAVADKLKGCTAKNTPKGDKEASMLFQQVVEGEDAVELGLRIRIGRYGANWGRRDHDWKGGQRTTQSAPRHKNPFTMSL